MYEDSFYVNPTLRNFWLNLKKNNGNFHVFKKNRNLVFFGNELSKSSYDFIYKRMNELKINYNPQEVENSYFQIIEKESGNNEKLVELAKKAVSEAFFVPEDLMECEINENSNVELNQTEEKYNFDYASLGDEVKNQINKRILLNCIIQGASIHSFYTMHHIVKNDINELDKDLVGLYDKFSVGSVRSYYSIDYSKILENLYFSEQAALGSSQIEYDEKNNPKILAQAKTFPVLCQELAKGSLELVCLHALENVSKEDLEKIFYFADKRIDEPRYIQIGSEVWRKLLEFFRFYKNENEKRIQIPDFIMKISLMSPENIEYFMENVFQNDFNEAQYFID